MRLTKVLKCWLYVALTTVPFCFHYTTSLGAESLWDTAVSFDGLKTCYLVIYEGRGFAAVVLLLAFFCAYMYMARLEFATMRQNIPKANTIHAAVQAAAAWDSRAPFKRPPHKTQTFQPQSTMQ